MDALLQKCPLLSTQISNLQWNWTPQKQESSPEAPHYDVKNVSRVRKNRLVVCFFFSVNKKKLHFFDFAVRACNFFLRQVV